MLKDKDIDKIGGVGDSANVIGDIAGIFGESVANFFVGVGEFIKSITFIEWIMIIFIVVGGFIVWYFKKKYDLKFKFWPKKKNKSFN